MGDDETHPRRSRSGRWMIGFLILLGISHLVRLLAPPSPEPPIGTLYTDLKPVVAGEPADDAARTLRFAYRDIPSSAGPSAPTLVLLHGSPMRAGRWDPFIDHLSPQFRLVIPELHGGGSAGSDLPDYSAEADAGYVDQLLAHLGIRSAHVVGYSTGGAVALQLAHLSSDGVTSLTLITPLAISELELVGDPTLNKLVYWAQKFYIWCGIYMIPHFGLLDRAPTDLRYARHYHQTDTRRLAKLIPEVTAPLLLIHGEGDMVRPAAASRELARRIPQAESRFIDGGHAAPLEEVETTTGYIREFVARAEAGTAVKRADADPARIAAADEPFSYDRYREDLRARVILMIVLLAIATLISEDITCITAGILAASGMLSFFHATLGCFLGIFVGDVGLYLIGRLLGPRALRVPPLRWFIKEEQVLASERFFAKYGAALVIVTRWLPGMRIPTYVAAGVLKLRFSIFIFYFLLAAIIWTPMLVGISTAVGGTLLGWLESIEAFAPLILVGIIAAIWFAIHFVMKRATKAFENKADLP